MKPNPPKGKQERLVAHNNYRSRISPNKPVVLDPKAGLLKKTDLLMLILLIFASAVIPLIVYLKSYDLKGTMLVAWTGSTEHVDFFNWWKAICLILVFVLLTGIHVFNWFTSRKTLAVPRLFLPLLLFEVFALLSAIASTVPDVAFGGFVDRSEGLWVLMSYGMLAFTAFVVAKDTKTVQIVLAGIFFGSLIISCIGFFQFVGVDFFQTDFGKRLILPKAYEQFMNQLTFNFGKNIMYTTVYNPNYLGSYSSLLLPVAWGMTFAWAEKGKSGGKSGTAVTRFLWLAGIVFTLAISILWLGSMSRAGLFGGAAAVMLFLVFQARTVLRNPLPALLLAIGMVGMYMLMNTVSGGLVSKEFQKTLPSSVQAALGQTPVSEEAVPAAPAVLPLQEGVPPVAPVVKAVTLKDNRFVFATETETLQLVMDKTAGGTFRFFDGNSSTLTLEQSGTDPNTQVFTDKRYAAYRISSVQKDQYSVLWYQYSFMLTNNNGVMTYTPKPNTFWTEVEPAPYIGFTGHERFATNRGWIWSRTFPLLGKAIFTGYGPDSFAVFFPQKDIAWKINLYGSSNIVVDKPHNWFLQTAMNTGIVSLLLLLWFLAAFFLDVIRTILGKKITGMETIAGGTVAPKIGSAGIGSAGIGSAGIGSAGIGSAGIRSTGMQAESSTERNIILSGILCGVAGYAMAGVFNDSVVSVAPVFWTMIGLGIGLLRFSARCPDKGKKEATGT